MSRRRREGLTPKNRGADATPLRCLITDRARYKRTHCLYDRSTAGHGSIRLSGSAGHTFSFEEFAYETSPSTFV